MNQSTNLTDHYELVDRLVLSLIDVLIMSHNVNLIFIVVPNNDI
jgi:hypothetical protein